MNNNCIFCKVVAGELPKDFLYQDENVMAFDDIYPVNKVHVLFISKVHYAAFENLTNDDFLASARKGIQQIVEEKGLIGKGYKVQVNGGGAQVISHLHLHLIGPTGLNAPIM